MNIAIVSAVRPSVLRWTTIHD